MLLSKATVHILCKNHLLNRTNSHICFSSQTNQQN